MLQITPHALTIQSIAVQFNAIFMALSIARHETDACKAKRIENPYFLLDGTSFFTAHKSFRLFVPSTLN